MCLLPRLFCCIKGGIKMNIKQKLSSRKLWAAVAGVVTGLAMVFGLDETVINTVAGAVVSVVSVMTYIITEGKIDAEGVKMRLLRFNRVLKR